MNLSYGPLLLILASLVAGCEQLGIETPAMEAAREEAEGKAIGSACRQSGRALEDCYQINRKAPKAAIFNGWRDMDAYMRENKIEVIKPEAEKAAADKSGAPEAAKEAPAAEAQNPAAKAEAPAAAAAGVKNEKAAPAKAADSASPPRPARSVLSR